MAELKTRPTGASVSEFIAGIPDEARRRDCRTVMSIMRQATGSRPKMWGTSIVGYGSYRYRYQSGREGDWFLVGFSPRKRDLTLYLMSGHARFPELMVRLGRYKTGKACLYFRKLEDVDLKVLEQLVRASVEHLTRAKRR